MSCLLTVSGMTCPYIEIALLPKSNICIHFNCSDQSLMGFEPMMTMPPALQPTNLTTRPRGYIQLSRFGSSGGSVAATQPPVGCHGAPHSTYQLLADILPGTWYGFQGFLAHGTPRWLQFSYNHEESQFLPKLTRPCYSPTWPPLCNPSTRTLGTTCSDQPLVGFEPMATMPHAVQPSNLTAQPRGYIHLSRFGSSGGSVAASQSKSVIQVEFRVPTSASSTEWT